MQQPRSGRTDGGEERTVDTVAVIGTGSVGTALGRGWADAYDVVFGTRRPDDPDVERLVAETGTRAAGAAEAIEGADVVVLAVPGSAVVDVARDLTGAIGDTPVVDPTNVVPRPTGGESLAARVAAAVPDAAVAKAFNTIGAEGMADPTFPDGTASMLVCGDDAAVAVAGELARALGFDVVDAGGLDAAMHLENLARLWIHLAGRHGRGIGFRLLGAADAAGRTGREE